MTVARGSGQGRLREVAPENMIAPSHTLHLETRGDDDVFDLAATLERIVPREGSKPFRSGRHPTGQ